ncbi:hypothetical protein IAU60_004478 [Kwoniella sp. DSM 27419]
MAFGIPSEQSSECGDLPEAEAAPEDAKPMERLIKKVGQDYCTIQALEEKVEELDKTNKELDKLIKQEKVYRVTEREALNREKRSLLREQGHLKAGFCRDLEGSQTALQASREAAYEDLRRDLNGTINHHKGKPDSQGQDSLTQSVTMLSDAGPPVSDWKTHFKVLRKKYEDSSDLAQSERGTKKSKK